LKTENVYICGSVLDFQETPEVFEGLLKKSLSTLFKKRLDARPPKS